MGIILFLPLLMGLSIAIGIVFLSRSRPAISGGSPAVSAVYRRLIGWRLSGLLLGLTTAIAIPVVTMGFLRVDSIEPLLIWTPGALALVMLLSLLGGERAAYRPATSERSAALTPRAARQYTRPRLLAVPALAIAGFAGLATSMIILTRDGNIQVTCASPYPDDYGYSAVSTIPDSSTWSAIANVLIAGLIAAAVTRSATFRARPDIALFASVEDDTLRHLTVRVSTGVYTAFVAIMSAVLTLGLAVALSSDFYPCQAPPLWNGIGETLRWSLVVWLGVYVWGVSQILARPVATHNTATIG